MHVFTALKLFYSRDMSEEAVLVPKPACSQNQLVLVTRHDRSGFGLLIPDRDGFSNFRIVLTITPLLFAGHLLQKTPAP